MEKLDEALRIDGFDAETQKEFDKLCAYLSVFKHRAKPSSPRYVTKLNEFQLKFMAFIDKATTNRAKLQIRSYISEIQNMLQKAEVAPPKEKPVNLGGGKVRNVRTAAKPAPSYASETGGEYYDNGVHVYEAPADEDEPEEVQTALRTLRRNGARVSR